MIKKIFNYSFKYAPFALSFKFQLYLIEMFYLNTMEQLFLFVEQFDQLEVCLPYSRLLAGIPILVWWYSKKVEFN